MSSRCDESTRATGKASLDPSLSAGGRNEGNFIYVTTGTSHVSNLINPSGLSGCFRCGFVWRPRSVNPRICPRCKSRLWDAPRLRPVRLGSGLGVREIVGPKRHELNVALRTWKARNPRVFGSVARAQATASSDLDLLVDFDEGASAYDQIGLANELQRVFRRGVDVTSEPGLHWMIRPQVLFEAVPV